MLFRVYGFGSKIKPCALNRQVALCHRHQARTLMGRSRFSPQPLGGRKAPPKCTRLPSPSRSRVSRRASGQLGMFSPSLLLSSLELLAECAGQHIFRLSPRVGGRPAPECTRPPSPSRSKVPRRASGPAGALSPFPPGGGAKPCCYLRSVFGYSGTNRAMCAVN